MNFRNENREGYSLNLLDIYTCKLFYLASSQALVFLSGSS